VNTTIYDVARVAGVSMATVSRVVNGNPNVKPTTRKKVLEAIESLAYRPNAVARGLASKRTTTVGVIIPDISRIFYAELARGIEDIATMYKYNIILCNSDQNKDKEIHFHVIDKLYNDLNIVIVVSLTTSLSLLLATSIHRKRIGHSHVLFPCYIIHLEISVDKSST